MNTEAEIRSLGARFVGRLDRSILEDALEWLHFNEWGLALEVLADQLKDEGVLLTAEECDKFDEIAEHMGLPRSRFAFLRSP